MEFAGRTQKIKISDYVTYLFIVHNWREESKGEGDLEKDAGKKVKHTHRHYVMRIQRDMRDIDADIDRSEGAGFKLGVRTFLLLRKSVYVQRILIRLLKDGLGKIEGALESVQKVVTDKKLHEHLEIVLKESKEVDHFASRMVAESIKKVHLELRGDQKAIFADMRELEGGMGVSFLPKGTASGLARRIQLRWGAIMSLRRNLSGEEKADRTVEGEIERVKADIDDLVKDINKHRLDKKKFYEKLRRDESEMKIVMAKLKEFFSKVDKIIKASYKVFLFDMLVLEEVVAILDKEKKTDIQAMAEHEIPLIMGKKDIKDLEDDKANIKGHLHTLRQWLLQLWQYANLVEKEGKEKVRPRPVRLREKPA